MEVEYNIDPNDADPASISSTVTVSSVADPGKSVTDTVAGDGTQDAELQCEGALFPTSADDWLTEVEVAYTVDGEAKTTDVSVTGDPEIWPFTMNADFGWQGGTRDDMEIGYEIDFTSKSADPMTYDVEFTSAVLEWAKDDGGGLMPTDSKVIWDGSGPSPYYGPYPSDDGTTKTIGYSFWEDSLDATPPGADETHFRLIFQAEGTGTDTDGAVYPFAEGSLTHYTDYLALP